MSTPMKIVLAIIAVFVCVALVMADFEPEEKNEASQAGQETLIKAVSHTHKSSTFVMAAKTAGLADTLRKSGPFTVFASTDSAFSKLPEGKFAEMMDKENKEQLKEIVSYHIIPSRIPSWDLEDGRELETLEGSSLKISHKNGEIYINGARVIKTDIESSNGIVHLVDEVMEPASQKKKITEKK